MLGERSEIYFQSKEVSATFGKGVSTKEVPYKETNTEVLIEVIDHSSSLRLAERRKQRKLQFSIKMLTNDQYKDFQWYRMSEQGKR